MKIILAAITSFALLAVTPLTSQANAAVGLSPVAGQIDAVVKIDRSNAEVVDVGFKRHRGFRSSRGFGHRGFRSHRRFRSGFHHRGFRSHRRFDGHRSFRRHRGFGSHRGFRSHRRFSGRRFGGGGGFSR